MLVVIVVVLGLTTLLVGAGWRTAAWFDRARRRRACSSAWLLNLPWSPTWSWDDLAAAPLAGPLGRGVLDVATMAIGQAQFEVLALALYLPVLVALAVARAWRLTWAARAAGLIVVFLGLAVLQDRDALPFAVPDVGVLLVPVALGLALSAASAVAAFSDDVAGRTFGWRQPLGLLSIAAVIVGLFPSVLTITRRVLVPAPGQHARAGRGRARRPTADGGDYRVLYLGDPRLIPFPSVDLGDGVAMALVDGGTSDLRRRWPVADQPADEELEAVIESISSSSTRRGGRLLAPFDVRYIVVPLVDGVDVDVRRSAARAERLARVARRPARPGPLDQPASTSPASRTGASIPTTARLDGAARRGVDGRFARRARRTSRRPAPTPVLPGADRAAPGGGRTSRPACSTSATPLDDAWTMRVGSTDVEGRASFGVATAYEVPGAGPAKLEYSSPSVEDAVVDRAGRAVGPGAGGGQPPHRAGAPAPRSDRATRR